ncbi:uncharacterized protein LOC121812411 [Xyrichtys novacula]|uniref:Uncharacterized protein LOC121812411 n=1 Tax=Xyrichtys novacula TaxID=13765 RepID=A0AAV1FYM6_XYRNO|nr:uncharacterized protein LOC121812411 [Xyrichtys novacula]
MERQQYIKVKATSESYCVLRKNVRCERARFNQGEQQANETEDSFITAPCALAENCSYGALHEVLIRDSLVVGLRDISIEEKMQLDKDLTLKKAINIARQSKMKKGQQTDLRGETKHDIDSVTTKQWGKKSPNPRTQNKQKHLPIETKALQGGQSCDGCGNPLDMEGGNAQPERRHARRGKKVRMYVCKYVMSA